MEPTNGVMPARPPHAPRPPARHPRAPDITSLAGSLWVRGVCSLERGTRPFLITTG